MRSRKFWTVLFIVYSGLMLWLLFDRPGYIAGVPYWEQVTAQLNLVPLRTLRLFAGLLNSGVRSYIVMAVINLGGNIIMFIPLGFLLPMVLPRCSSWTKILLTTAGLIIIIELIQLFTLVGSCDIDDLILNILGSALGFAIQQQLKKPAP